MKNSKRSEIPEEVRRYMSEIGKRGGRPITKTDEKAEKQRNYMREYRKAKRVEAKEEK